MAAAYHSDRQAVSTARFCRAGQLATTDTCHYLYTADRGAEYCDEQVRQSVGVFTSIWPEMFATLLSSHRQTFGHIVHDRAARSFFGVIAIATWSA